MRTRYLTQSQVYNCIIAHINRIRDPHPLLYHHPSAIHISCPPSPPLHQSPNSPPTHFNPQVTIPPTSAPSLPSLIPSPNTRSRASSHHPIASPRTLRRHAERSRSRACHAPSTPTHLPTLTCTLKCTCTLHTTRDDTTRASNAHTHAHTQYTQTRPNVRQDVVCRIRGMLPLGTL
ncbi:hypothetical protein EJ05DRAFT_176872 [Pseudovirgaria hyperparasitica]|uniref:Uncharacterized protein n=1 Tax=Pseudovirgaria hyperparasitica TaxID=470096 RepID=A0A6A6WJM7_9PEZI|nr:uncharacterized protein EJ05DRAFT_176872 [Pseudovirgaria hyperparasitica]KAF2761571.1 hypothetical protein EJ05DRAFT_176872 [Pseudovirgaria hyperparasitica]